MTDSYHLHAGLWRRRGLPALGAGEVPGEPVTPPDPAMLRVSSVAASVIPFPVTPNEPRFQGDPGIGKYYIGWAEPQTLATGASWSQRPMAVYHGYSTATNAMVHAAKLDTAINNGCIASQSFKLSTWSPAQVAAGSADAAIDASADLCIARAPWPIWLCYYHEPEDNFPDATTATAYRAAYRRVVQRFRAKGVTNVSWMPIYMCPWTFDGSGRDWRWWHADWKGSGSGSAQWWSGADQMMDLMGLDVYDPLPGATGNKTFQGMLNSAKNAFAAASAPSWPIVIPEFGISNVASPTPEWVAWCTQARDYAKANNIAAFVYWNNNNDTPRRYDFTSASDPTGNKLAGWRVITSAASNFTPPS